MLFETVKSDKTFTLEVGDIIEFIDHATGEKVRRLVTVGEGGYICFRLDTMEQVLKRTSLNGVADFYKYEVGYRIIKAENLKIVEVA